MRERGVKKEERKRYRNVINIKTLRSNGQLKKKKTGEKEERSVNV